MVRPLWSSPYCISTNAIPVAIRFFRQLIGLQDVFYIRHLIDKDVFSPILDILIATMPRDNLLGSACLEFFEFIKKEDVKDIMKHLVQNYREQLVALSGFETFRVMINRYDQTQGFTAASDFLMDSEEEMARRPTGHSRMMEQLHVDPVEEEYWNVSDEEEENTAEKAPAANGASPATRQLVDYLSDGDDEDEMEGEQGPAEGAVEETPDKPEEAAKREDGPEDAPAASDLPDAESDEAKVSGSQVDGSSEAISSTESDSEAGPEPGAVPPPRRLSEKRRREEEEDDDELGKMMQIKRRNSKGVAANATTQSLLKRKGSFTGGNGGAGKIAISISPTAGLRSNEES